MCIQQSPFYSTPKFFNGNHNNKLKVLKIIKILFMAKINLFLYTAERSLEECKLKQKLPVS